MANQPNAADRILSKGKPTMAEQQLPLDGAASRPPRNIPPPTPTEQRRMLVNGTADFHRSFPQEPGDMRTTEELVDDALANGAVRLHTQEELLDRHDADEQDAAAALARGEITHIISTTSDPFAVVVTEVPNSKAAAPGGEGAEPAAVYSIPHQAQIECRPLADGGIEIWQEGQHGHDEESVTIHVAAGNVVMLARLLLFAAGFSGAGIHCDTGRGHIDLLDGDTAAGLRSEHQPRS